MSKWYHIIGQEGHQGAGKSREVELYMWGNDISEMLKKYRRIPRIKKGRNKIPDTRLLSSEESSKLEEQIISERRVSIERAKKDYYLSPQSHNMIINT